MFLFFSQEAKFVVFKANSRVRQLGMNRKYRVWWHMFLRQHARVPQIDIPSSKYRKMDGVHVS
jgi:hypothetical protein